MKRIGLKCQLLGSCSHLAYPLPFQQCTNKVYKVYEKGLQSQVRLLPPFSNVQTGFVPEVLEKKGCNYPEGVNGGPKQGCF